MSMEIHVRKGYSNQFSLQKDVTKCSIAMSDNTYKKLYETSFDQPNIEETRNKQVLQQRWVYNLKLKYLSECHNNNMFRRSL